jgi:GDPmannose 4,6-dehydratase
MTRKAIIVGSRGQDGQLLWSQLESRGYTLVGWTREGVNGIALPVAMQSASIQDAAAVANVVDFFRPDEIYFLAAHHHSAEEASDNPAELFRHSIDVHVLALVNFLEAIRRHSPAAHLFFAASSHVFGTPANDTQDESTLINPESAYGISKAAGIFACRHYRKYERVFAACGILYNHESWLRSEKFLSRKISLGVARIKRGLQTKLILGNLEAVADWGYAPDYVEAMRLILAAPRPDDFVVATGKAHTVREFAHSAFDSVGLDYKLYVVPDRDLVPSRPGRLIGSPSHLASTTGWEPKMAFGDMVRSLVAHELDNIDAS